MNEYPQTLKARLMGMIREISESPERFVKDPKRALILIPN